MPLPITMISGVTPILRDAPELPGAHEAGLHLVGDVERVVAFTEFLHRRQIAFMRHGKTVGCRNGLHDHRGNVPSLQGIFHGVQVVEGDLHEFTEKIFGQEISWRSVHRLPSRRGRNGRDRP